MTRLYLDGNAAEPVPLSVSLQAEGESAVRVAVPVGAPFPMTVPVAVTNGRLADGAEAIAVPAGATSSAPVRVERLQVGSGEVTARVGTLPGLPPGHAGYALEPAAGDPLIVAGPLGAGICGRTAQVRDAIVAAIDGVDDCANVTVEHLSALAGALILADWRSSRFSRMTSAGSPPCKCWSWTTTG